MEGSEVEGLAFQTKGNYISEELLMQSRVYFRLGSMLQIAAAPVSSLNKSQLGFVGNFWGANRMAGAPAVTGELVIGMVTRWTLTATGLSHLVELPGAYFLTRGLGLPGLVQLPLPLRSSTWHHVCGLGQLCSLSRGTMWSSFSLNLPWHFAEVTISQRSAALWWP